MKTARVRALLAELTLALDELDAEDSPRPRKAVRRPVPPPDRAPSAAVLDRVRRTARRKGLV